VTRPLNSMPTLRRPAGAYFDSYIIPTSTQKSIIFITHVKPYMKIN